MSSVCSLSKGVRLCIVASQRLGTARRKLFNFFFYRGLTETWDCKRAAELLHMAVPVSVRAEPRHWACALLCIASYGWQRDHKMDGWNRYALYGDAGRAAFWQTFVSCVIHLSPVPLLPLLLTLLFLSFLFPLNKALCVVQGVQHPDRVP